MRIRHAALTDLEAMTLLEKDCFPAAEAASRESFQERLRTYPAHFWLLEEDGEIISAINGMATHEDILRDEMFADASMHQEDGAWQMIFGVETAPNYQHKGYAAQVMRAVIQETKQQGRKGLVLTCKELLIPFYEQFGFVNEGKSQSEHGGAVWFDMRLKF